MSEQQTTATPEEPQGQEQQQPQELTYEQRVDGLIADLGGEEDASQKAFGEISGLLDELKDRAHSGNLDDVAEANRQKSYIEERLQAFQSGGAESTTESTEEEPTSQEGQTGAPEAGKPGEEKPGDAGKKAFGVWHNGQRIELPDDNGLLGYKNTGALKAAKAKLELRLRDQERDFEAAQRKIAEYEQKLKDGVAQPQAAPAAPPAQPQKPPVVKVERPTPPAPPKLSTNDPLDYSDEDKAELSRYYRETAEYNTNMAKHLEYLESRPARAEMPDEARRELETLRKWQKENAPLFDSIRSREEQEKLERSEREHWGRFESFQNAHREEFGTSKPVKEVHGQVMKWMDTIADMNGIQRPSTPQNLNDPTWQEYLGRRKELVDKYFAGDEAVVNNSQGFDPPEGHEAYFRLVELEGARRDLIAQGRATEKTPMEDIYWLHMRDNGHVEDALTRARREAENAGQESVVSAISEASNSAQNLDPSQSAGPDAQEIYGVPQRDFEWFSDIVGNPFAVERLSGEEKKRYELIRQTIERNHRRA